ncbi:MAG TPA: glycoside hydrolase family 2 protein [Pyrinomonadaceae bacterium]
MKSIRILFGVMMLVMLDVNSLRAQPRTQSLRQSKIMIPLQRDWFFREVGKPAWYPATVPGCVHTDLLSNKLIDDPFWRDNEKRLQWIGKTDWEYRTTFNLTPELLKRTNVELVFEGLDTYANVFLNDASMLNTDNMFRTWRADAKSLLKPGLNTLRIHFRSPINEILPVMAKMDYELPAGNDQGEKTSPHTRKAPYQYGWDWGPRFVTTGIWRPIYLEAWNEARINDLHLLPKQITPQAASMTAQVEVVANVEVGAKIIVENMTDKTVVATRAVTLTRGVNNFALDFVINKPSLWWPNGLGAHPLYTFKARLLIGGKTEDQIQRRTGLRSVELKQEKDDVGKSFTFVVNGVPIFAKGGNWIPADSFPTRITTAKYRQLLESVRDANMNMLRVWGGGIYERDDFYELCDEMGILIWQDFMFGCSLYPGDQAFLDNVRQEAIDNVKRLRNHPAIVVWVGNNEIESGWFHWGWKEKLPAKLWDDYLKLFYGVLPEVCAALDPSRPYWPSSPSSKLEDDNESQKMGDLHYWQVWHAAAPFTDYEKQSPRFMSEYGFQSFPQIETVDTYTIPADHDIGSPVMMAHQRHPRGNQLIQEYMLREYPKPKDFQSFLYVSQVLQAEGIKIGAEHLRRIKPHNMGSLYWQIDDCWPVASWSSIDYTGRWKALQYYARRFYSEVLVSPRKKDANIEIAVVSDRLRALPGQLRLSLLDFNGKPLWQREQDVSVEPLKSKSYVNVPTAGLLEGRDPKTVFLFVELVIGGKTVSSNEYFFAPFKNLSLPRPEISTQVVATRGGFKLTLSSDKLARAVYLSAPGYRGSFRDNYFDLIPGRAVEVDFHTTEPIKLSEFRDRLKIRTLQDAF